MRVVFFYVHDRFTPFSTAVAALSGAVRDLGHEHLLCAVEVGTTAEAAAERIVALRPDVLAASFMSRDFDVIARVLGLVRARSAAFLAVGGYHATLAAASVASGAAGASSATDAAGAVRAAIDAIGIGEGERPLRRLLTSLADGTVPSTGPGLWVRGPDGFAGSPPPADREPDIAALPAWDYGLFGELAARSSMHGYVRRDRFMPLRASRGCPFDCTYCSNPQWKQVNGLRALGVRNVRPVDHLVDEAVSLAACFEPEGFEFWDEHFPVDLRWIEAFADAWRSRVALPFRVEMHPNTASPERLSALARAGCVLVQLGVESGDEGLRRDVLKRRTSDALYARVFADVRALGMKTSASVMAAMPGETLAMGRRSVALLRELAPDYMSYAAYAPLPGTELGARARPRAGGDAAVFRSTFTAFEPQIEPDAMTVDEARTLLQELGALQKERMDRLRTAEGLVDAPPPAALSEAVRAALGATWSLGRAELDGEHARVVLAVQREGARELLEVEIRPREAGRSHFVATDHLHFSYRGRELPPPHAEALRALARAFARRTFDELRGLVATA